MMRNEWGHLVLLQDFSRRLLLLQLLDGLQFLEDTNTSLRQ